MLEENRVEAEVFEAIVDGTGMRIGLVQARFNAPVCEALRQSCLDTLADLGVSDDDVVVMTVPGALEIPGVLSKLAQSMQFDALIAIGAVIRGETYHFEVVSNESAAGIRQVALELTTNKPWLVRSKKVPMLPVLQWKWLSFMR
jgi:6,7-dimethyl-8-ribityllumazine synthase